MYKALVNIGEYKKGQIVPDELAETWLKMYLVPQVEKISEVKESKSSEQINPEVPSDDLLMDYLGRNTHVVVKNIQTDKLNKAQLDKLLILEKSGKKRQEVIKALEKRRI